MAQYGAHGAAAFSPSSVSGLELWLEGDQVTGKADTNPVTTWEDATSNNRDATAPVDQEPTYKASGPNSKPYLLFGTTGSNKWMTTASFAVPQPSTTILVMNQTVWAGGVVLLDSGGAVQELAQVTATPTVKVWNGGAYDCANGDLAVNTWAVVTLIANGASSSLRVNNGTPATGNLVGDLDGIMIGGRFNNVAHADVAYAVITVYSGALSDANRQYLERGFGTKYAIGVA